MPCTIACASCDCDCDEAVVEEEREGDLLGVLPAVVRWGVALAEGREGEATLGGTAEEDGTRLGGIAVLCWEGAGKSWMSVSRLELERGN